MNLHQIANSFQIPTSRDIITAVVITRQERTWRSNSPSSYETLTVRNWNLNDSNEEYAANQSKSTRDPKQAFFQRLWRITYFQQKSWAGARYCHFTSEILREIIPYPRDR